MGGLQATGGVFEMAGGGTAVAGGVATSEIGVGVPVAIGGGLLAAHGADDFQAGLRTLFGGTPTPTFTNLGLQKLGATPQEAGMIEFLGTAGAGGLAGGSRLLSAGSLARTAPLDLGPAAGGVGRTFLTATDFADLPATGTVDPLAVRFSQDSAGANFKPPFGSVDQFAQDLSSGAVDPSAVEPIRIVVKDGDVYTLDNRRLYAFQQAGVDVPYQKLDAIPNNQLFKFTTTNNGETIVIRPPKQ